MRCFSLTVVLTGWLTSTLNAASLDGTIIAVSKTGFVLQTSKGPKSVKFSDHDLKGGPSPYGRDHDLMYRVKAANMKVGMEVHVEYRTVDGEWVTKGVRTFDAQIDFARLAKVDDKYTLQLTLVAADGTRLEKKYEIEAGTSMEAVRDRVLKSLQPVPPPKERWAVFAWGKNYLAVEGFIHDDKFSPIERIVSALPELKSTQEPLVRQKRQTLAPLTRSEGQQIDPC